MLLGVSVLLWFRWLQPCVDGAIASRLGLGGEQIICFGFARPQYDPESCGGGRENNFPTGPAQKTNASHKSALELGVGVNSGPVVGDVVERLWFVYAVWGDTVNVASRLETMSAVGRVHTSDATVERVSQPWTLQSRGIQDIAGQGKLETFWICAPEQCAACGLAADDHALGRLPPLVRKLIITGASTITITSTRAIAPLPNTNAVRRFIALAGARHALILCNDA
ncbi:MAG: hypothetical protein ACI8PT_004555 [Gammaproteobacteria bacterium]|jgi:hypothetical protein